MAKESGKEFCKIGEELRELTDGRYAEIKGWHIKHLARMEAFEIRFETKDREAKIFRRKSEAKQQAMSDCLSNVAENTKFIRELFEDGSALVHLINKLSAAIHFLVKRVVLPIAALVVLIYVFTDLPPPAWYVKLQGWVD